MKKQPRTKQEIDSLKILAFVGFFDRLPEYPKKDRRAQKFYEQTILNK